jgi:hypothetical protein
MKFKITPNPNLLHNICPVNNIQRKSKGNAIVISTIYTGQTGRITWAMVKRKAWQQDVNENT